MDTEKAIGDIECIVTYNVTILTARPEEGQEHANRRAGSGTIFGQPALQLDRRASRKLVPDPFPGLENTGGIRHPTHRHPNLIWVPKVAAGGHARSPKVADSTQSAGHHRWEEPYRFADKGQTELRCVAGMRPDQDGAILVCVPWMNSQPAAKPTAA